MSKGFVYIMTSSIDGLIKIGKSKDWNRRCQSELESNGYKNANGLKTYFVVEVDDQEEIEGTMHDIFRESRVSNFELFAVDKDRAKRVLSKMGKQVYPDLQISTTSNSTSNVIDYYDQFWKALDLELDKYVPKNTTSYKRAKSYYQGDRLKAANCYIAIDFRSKSKICVNVIVPRKNINTVYATLLNNKSSIESQLGYSLIWDEKFSKQGSSTYIRIAYYLDNDPSKIDSKCVVEVAKKAIEMLNVFNQY